MLDCGLASPLAIHLMPALSLAQGSIWLTPAQWMSVVLMVGGMLVLIFAMRQKQAAGTPAVARPPRFWLPRIRFETSAAAPPPSASSIPPPPAPPPPPATRPHIAEPALPDPRGIVRDAEE